MGEGISRWCWGTRRDSDGHLGLGGQKSGCRAQGEPHVESLLSSGKGRPQRGKPPVKHKHSKTWCWGVWEENVLVGAPYVREGPCCRTWGPGFCMLGPPSPGLVAVLLGCQRPG